MKDLDKAYNRAKLKFIMSGSTFLATIAFSVKQSFTESVPTAATDGLNIFINPEYFLKLSEDERVGLLAHETWHIALLHFARIGTRDRTYYNMAGDYCINILLKNNGYILPKGALLKNEYENWSTTRIYDDLIENNTTPPTEYIIDLLEIDPANAIEEDDVLTKQDIENKIKGIIVKAHTQAKMSGEKLRGTLPADISRIVEDLINPVLDWGTILHNYFSEQARDDYSYRKPNRRYFPDYYVPSLNSEGLMNITVAVDTSGSIDDTDLKKILSEIDNIHKTYRPSTLTILDCDTQINHTHVLHKDNGEDILSLKFTGGGGTDFNPVIEYCNNNQTNVLLYFTDLYGHMSIEPTDYKIFWICYSDHKPWRIGETIYYNPQMRR